MKRILREATVNIADIGPITQLYAETYSLFNQYFNLFEGEFSAADFSSQNRSKQAASSKYRPSNALRENSETEAKAHDIMNQITKNLTKIAAKTATLHSLAAHQYLTIIYKGETEETISIEEAQRRVNEALDVIVAQYNHIKEDCALFQRNPGATAGEKSIVTAIWFEFDKQTKAFNGKLVDYNKTAKPPRLEVHTLFK
jgi:hypothetical protein